MGQIKLETHTQQQLQPMVAVLYKALLDPVKYDNYKLWHMIYDAKLNVRLAIKAAEIIAQEKWCTVARIDGIHITYPTTNLFLLNLFSLFNDKKETIKNILVACINPQHASEIDKIEQYSKGYPLLNIDKETGTINSVEYLGHPKNQNANNCWGMFVLAGFVTALGIAAVAVALTALTSGLAIAALVAGAAVGLTGLGLFAYSAHNCSQNNSFIPKEDDSSGIKPH